MTNIVEQLFKSLDPWPGFQITSFKIQGSSSKPSVAKPNETKMFRSVFPNSLKKSCFLP